MVTFVVTASGVTLIGVGGAFWGLVAGCLMLLLFRRRPPADGPGQPASAALGQPAPAAPDQPALRRTSPRSQRRKIHSGFMKSGCPKAPDAPISLNPSRSGWCGYSSGGRSATPTARRTRPSATDPIRSAGTYTAPVRVNSVETFR